jgi:hypothetical protein
MAEQKLGLGSYELEAAKRTEAYRKATPQFEKSLDIFGTPDHDKVKARANRERLAGMISTGEAQDITDQVDAKQLEIFDRMKTAYQFEGIAGLVTLGQQVYPDKSEKELMEMVKGYKVHPDHESVPIKGLGNLITYSENGKRKTIFVPDKADEGVKKPIFNKAGDLVLPSGLTISKSTLESEGEQFLLTDKMPSMGMKAGPIRQAIIYYKNEASKKYGLDAGQVVSMRAKVKALTKSLDKQQINIGATGSFVRNMSKQREELRKVAKEIERMDDRYLNVPINVWANKVKGDPKWKKYVTLVTDLSLEAGKLAGGNASSIAELSVGAQERWTDIHDLDMSISGLGLLMDQTVEVGGMRYDSLLEESTATENLIRTGGGAFNKSDDAIPIGTIEDGYEFTGGDPSKKENWKKVN